MKHALLSLIVVTVLLIPVVAKAGDGYVVRLRPGAAGSKLAPRYSPKGYKVQITLMDEQVLEGFDHREGRLRLGPSGTRGEGHLLVLARSAENKPFDLLWIDKDGDGSIADDDMLRVDSRTSRGKVYTSYTCDVRVNHGSQEKPSWEPYPIALWVAVEAEDKVPEFIRYSRRGFRVGSVSIDEAAYEVVLSDANNDAVFGTGDWWAILPADGDRTNSIGDSRKVGDFAWAGRKAYKLELEGTAGCEGRIVAFDPGITPEADARKRDPHWDDKHAERAQVPVAFEHEIENAIKEARTRKAHYFLDFETDWCGPCKQMDRWVYTARNVVVAAKGIVCIKVDGDKRKDLKERHGVSGFPTGILFDPDGTEIARFTGYQTGARMVTFLTQAHADK